MKKPPKQYYRFPNGVYVKANTFDEAVEAIIKDIREIKEDQGRWHHCACTGFSHSFGCEMGKWEIEEYGVPF